MKTIAKATFSGKDGSMGFIHGRRYEISIQQLHKSSSIRVSTDQTHPGWCVYGSVNAFLLNWSEVEIAERKPAAAPTNSNHLNG